MSRLTKRVGTSYGAWSRQTTDDEYLRKLKFPNGARIYDQMRRSDPQVNAVLQAVYLQLISASWVIEPAKDGGSQAEEIAKFVEMNLFPGRREIDTSIPYRTPWTQTLRNILLHLPFGYMVIEKVYTLIDGKYCIRDLGPRLPKTIKEFRSVQNGNEIEKIIQRVNGRSYDLPANKCIIFTFNKEGTNPVGISFLRPIYKPRAIKDDLEKLQAMMFERFALGVPVGTVSERAHPGDEEYTSLEEALENVGSNQSGYIVLPNGQEIDILNGGANTAPDIKAAITYYDQQISIAWLAMFMNLGTSTSGNRSLGDTFMDFFLTTVQSIGDSISDTLNNELIPELVKFNFKTNSYPQIKILPIKEVDLEVVSMLKNAGLLTMTEQTEQRIRELVRLNRLEEGEYEEARKSGNEIGSNRDSEDLDADNSDDVEDDGSSSEDGTETKKSESSLSDFESVRVDHEKIAHTEGQCNCESCRTKTISLREPKPFELEFGVLKMQDQLDSAQNKTLKELIKIRNRQGRFIAKQAGLGVKASQISVPYRREMEDYLKGVYKSQVAVGKEQETKRAKEQGVNLSDIPTSATTLESLMDEVISLESNGSADKLKSMLMSEAIRLQRKGLSGNTLEKRLIEYLKDKISESTWQNLASTVVNGGWGDGHNIVTSANADRIQHQIYSAVLDKDTCEDCRAKDSVLHAVGDPGYITPNPGCYGGGRCRCVNVTFYKVEKKVDEKVDV
jgi:hypothetical protein